MSNQTIKALRTVVLGGIVGLFLVSQTGCLLFVAAAGTGGTVAYLKGDSEILMDGTSEFPSRPEMERGLTTFAQRAGVRVRVTCGEWTAKSRERRAESEE